MADSKKQMETNLALKLSDTETRAIKDFHDFIQAHFPNYQFILEPQLDPAGKKIIQVKAKKNSETTYVSQEVYLGHDRYNDLGIAFNIDPKNLLGHLLIEIDGDIIFQSNQSDRTLLVSSGMTLDQLLRSQKLQEKILAFKKANPTEIQRIKV